MSNQTKTEYIDAIIDNPEQLEVDYKSGMLSNQEYNNFKSRLLDNSDIVAQGIQQVNASLQCSTDDEDKPENPDLFNESWQEPDLSDVK